jgi:hypothetical protein
MHFASDALREMIRPVSKRNIPRRHSDGVVEGSGLITRH